MELRDKINKLSLQAQTTPLGSTCDTSLLFEVLNEAEELESVLDIIIKKNVDIYVLKTCISLEHYNSEIKLKNQNNTYSYEVWYELTQNEYDTLKENTLKEMLK